MIYEGLKSANYCNVSRHYYQHSRDWSPINMWSHRHFCDTSTRSQSGSVWGRGRGGGLQSQIQHSENHRTEHPFLTQSKLQNHVTLLPCDIKHEHT